MFFFTFLASHSQNSILDCYWFDSGWRSVHRFGVGIIINRLSQSVNRVAVERYSRAYTQFTDQLFICHQDGRSLSCVSL